MDKITQQYFGYQAKNILQPFCKKEKVAEEKKDEITIEVVTHPEIYRKIMHKEYQAQQAFFKKQFKKILLANPSKSYALLPQRVMCKP